jgi:SAM-dependent methyltransferase
MNRTRVKPGHEILRSLSDGLLRSVHRDGLTGNTLEIHHGFAPLFEPALANGRAGPFGLSLSLNLGREALSGQRLQCDSGSLPFQDGVFDRVVLHHVVEDGKEPELSEAVRVLARDGMLVLIGLNRFGWRYRAQGAIRKLPGLSPFRIRAELERLDMRMKGCAGAGLLNRERPVFMSRGLSGFGLPIADVVLMLAGHRHGPQVTPLRFRKLRAGIVQSAS